MIAKLKDGVFGFIYNFESGEIEDIFTEELTNREIELMGRVAGDDICIILENEDVEMIFGDELDEEDIKLMELGKVLEIVG